jgi:pimeloyl-ACP methyl ester carboxylesterase
MIDAITPFHLHIPDSELEDLHRRLDATRWPEPETVADWSQGAPLDKVQALCAYWRSTYVWRACEARLNALGQFHTRIDDLDIHFLHIQSPQPDAMPLLLTHGWPGSVVEFLNVIGPLTDPVAHGGDARDAFHVIAPSLPGFGFSSKPTKAGIGVSEIADIWIKLMERLDYTDWVAQGGDWGAAVTNAIGAKKPASCRAIHLNFALAMPQPEDLATLTPSEQSSLADAARYQDDYSGYARIQATRPQTLGYGLTDSPAGQAAWIYEKIQEWSQCDGDCEALLSRDSILDNIMLYWLTSSAASSGRLYWESLKDFTPAKLDLPVGVSVFPGEFIRPSRRWAERLMPNIIHWGEVERGGHFAAWEQPELFVKELRECFRNIR